MDSDLFLRLQDLNLLASASRYDLSDELERKRSASDLSELFFRLVKTLKPDLFIEAGAKAASSSRRAADMLKEARVVAFEANPYTYDRFKADHDTDVLVEYLHLALSDEPGEVTFNVRLNHDGEPMADGHGSLMDRKPGYEHDFHAVTVQATTLDQHFANHAFESCAIWMDVEGASEAVLKGAASILERASLLIIEVEDRVFWQGAWTMPETARFLLDQGLVPVARDFEFPYQNNVVFVRETVLNHYKVRRRLAEHLAASPAS